MTKENTDLIEALWNAHDLAPDDGVCPVEDCDDCLKCSIFELVSHLESPTLFPHP